MIPTSQLPAWTDGPQHWCADVADMFGRYYPSQNPHLVLHVAAVLSANANKKTGRKCMLGRNNIAKTLGTTERSRGRDHRNPARPRCAQRVPAAPHTQRQRRAPMATHRTQRR